MRELKVTIYEHAKELPDIPEGNYFHSPELMELCERTPRQKPLMAVVTQNGEVAAHMLALIYYRRSWLPPYIYINVRVMSEGVYHLKDEEHNEQQLFGLMAEAITERSRPEINE